ncbi:MAG: M23 family metallopeptidase [Nakamurella sp.]
MSTSASTGAADVPAEVTPVLASANTEPVPVTGTDGNVYLAYELYLTNITSTPVTVDSVQAVDADTGAALQTYSGADLVSHTKVVGTAPGGAPASSVVLGGGQLAIVWLDPSVTGREELPTSLLHQVKLTFATAPSPLIPAELTENVAATAVSGTPAPTIKSPLEGSNWFDGNGCCDEVTPHRGASNPINGEYFFAERFAIDWVQLTADLGLFTGDPTELASYAYYGAPIHAVADGEIVAVYDELQDQTPGANPPEGSLTLAQYGGNHVVERFEQNGRTYFAFYAHLKPGTAKAAVTVGQTVKAGDVLGELGNSGNTDAPHLHFHVMDGPDPLASNGLPYQFESMQLVGQASGDAAIDPLFTGQPLALAPDGQTGERTDEMPLYLDLVNLTAAATSGASSSGATSSSAATPSGTPSSGTSSSSVPSSAPSS